MGQVTPLPAFTVCACGKHGRLIASDGTPVMEVYSKKLGRLSLGVAYEHGRIDRAGLLLCQEQLRASTLPEGVDDALRDDAELCRRVHAWNDAMGRGAALDPERFHQWKSEA